MNEFPSYIFINDLSIRERVLNNVIRTDMGSGLSKTKPKDSAPVRIISFDVSINRNDYKKFKEWFAINLRYGQLFFLLRDPLSGEIKRFRFENTEIDWAKVGSILTANFSLESYDV